MTSDDSPPNTTNTPVDRPSCNAELTVAIKDAIEAAQTEGEDYTGQTQRAVKRVLELRPDMTADAALWFVKRVRK